MTGHVFLSYHHDSDGAYAVQLAEHLTGRGIRIWFDREIISGDRWHEVIREQIDSCAALIVIMSPGSERSVWVNREITHAEKRDKPIFPLLRAGDGFFRLGDVQHEDVSRGQMPSQGFADRLSRHQAGVQPVADTAEVAILARQHNDACAMGDQGDHAGAVRLLHRVVADRTRVLGADHADTLTSRQELADYIGEGGDRAQAIRLSRQILDDRLRALGADHPDTLTTRNMIAYNLGESGNRAEAIRLYREVLADRIRVLGADNRYTLLSRLNLAHNIGKGGDRAEAVRQLRPLVADQIRVLGADHEDTKSGQSWLKTFGG